MRAIEAARRVAHGETESVSDPQQTLVQAIRHLRYVMERFDVTKKDLGVTPHGLRHQYATDEYRDSTGSPPPVNGGGAVERELDTTTRRDIAERLGHGRVQITNAYLGQSVVMRSKAPKRPPGAESDGSGST